MTHQEDMATSFLNILDVMGESVVFDGTTTVTAVIDDSMLEQIRDVDGLEQMRQVSLSFLASDLTPTYGQKVTINAIDWYVNKIDGPKDGIYTITVNATQTIERGRQTYRGVQ